MSAFQTTLPPSVVAKRAKEETPQKQSREDWRKMKELEEMRKAGTAPAMTDEEGKDINPHIPQYIMQAPWYFGTENATLRHQRPQSEKQKTYSALGNWFKKGIKEGPVATKYRKGACENCGAMTHKKKDCLERPRKVGAKFTGEHIAPDEHVQPDLSFDYEGKRDRWNGYNPDEHKDILEEFAKVEEAKRLLKEQRVEQALMDGEEVPQTKGGEDSEDEDKYVDDVDMPGQKFETKQRITVRNLRIREDTAKYLHNLDPNSAFYDPKTRSMRENPFKNSGKDQTDVPYTGDNFVRYSGDAQQFAKKQMFAWEAYEHGTDIHLQADPTKLELLSKEVVKRKDEAKTFTKDSILEKYGGQEHLEAPPKQLLLAQTEDYVEYSRHGTVIKGQEKPVVRSKYREDVYINNHTSVWGSYWRDCHWGYKCCYSIIKESYCTGEAGKLANTETGLIAVNVTEGIEEEEDIPKSLLQQHQERRAEKKSKKKKKKKQRSKTKKKREGSSSESDSELSSESDSDDGGRNKKKKKRKHKKRAESSSSDLDSELDSGDGEKKKKKKKRKHKKQADSSSSDSDSESDSEEEEKRQKQKKLKKALKAEAASQHKADKLLSMDERKRPYNSMYEAKAPTEEETEAWLLKRQRMEDPMAAFMDK